MSEIIKADNAVIESLKNQVEELKGQLLTKENELTVANEKNSALEIELQSAHSVNAELSLMIESLSLKAEKQTTEPVFEFQGTVYGFHYHKTVLGGLTITHEDVINSVFIQTTLVESKSGMVYPKN